MLLVYLINLDIFRRENDVALLAPNFAYSIMGYLMTISERLNVTRISKLNKNKRKRNMKIKDITF